VQIHRFKRYVYVVVCSGISCSSPLLLLYGSVITISDKAILALHYTLKVSKCSTICISDHLY